MIAATASHAVQPRPRVLIIDDERPLRSLMRRFLDRQGWDVCEADSGEQGLAMIEECGGRLDAVIVDQNLPGLSGSGVCRRLTSQRPSLAGRLLLASGDAESATIALALESLYCPVLAKPFDLLALDRALASLVTAH